MQPWMWKSWWCFQFWRKPVLSLYLQGRSFSCTHYINHDLENIAKQGHTVSSAKLAPNLVEGKSKEIPVHCPSPSFIEVSLWRPPLYWSTLVPVTLKEKFSNFVDNCKNPTEALATWFWGFQRIAKKHSFQDLEFFQKFIRFRRVRLPYAH